MDLMKAASIYQTLFWKKRKPSAYIQYIYSTQSAGKRLKADFILLHEQNLPVDGTLTAPLRQFKSVMLTCPIQQQALAF